MSLPVRLVANGDSSLSVLFDEPISDQLCSKIHGFSNEITRQLGQQLEEVIPAYQSITLQFDPLKVSHCFLHQQLKNIINSQPKTAIANKQIIKIPVCYETAFSPDLDYLAKRVNLSKADIIQRHSQVIYNVQMLGFSPGFLYLSGLDSQLYCPRKNTPSLKVAAGSIGIGGQQTGIYPQASPGGWQIIGRTPIQLFDPNKEEPTIAKPLDKIQFVAINSESFAQLNEHPQ